MTSSRLVHSPPAVVIGLDSITGLQTARILAGRGVPVIALARDRRHYCSRTRVCRRIVAPDIAGESLIESLEVLGRSLPARGVLFPCTDMSVLAAAAWRERLEPWYHIDLPALETVERLMDKVRFTEFSQQQDLPIPTTRVLRGRDDALRAARELVFPCIVKPALKSPRWEQASPAKVFKVSDTQELLALYDRCSAWTDVLLAQEWVAGGDAELYSFNGYFDAHSRPLATFIARKIRQWPPETGTSCLSEECRNDEVLEQSVRLFQAARFRGLGYLEMKRDVRTSRYYIIEPNIGRPTGRSAMAEAAGVELLYTKYCDNLGWPLPSRRQQTYGHTKWIDLRRDVQSAVYYWRRGELSLSQWWRSWRGEKAHAVFSWRDPAPFVAELHYAARKLWSKTLRSAAEQHRSLTDQQTVAHAADSRAAWPLSPPRSPHEIAPSSCGDRHVAHRHVCGAGRRAGAPGPATRRPAVGADVSSGG